MYQLNKGAKVIKRIGENALKFNKERSVLHYYNIFDCMDIYVLIQFNLESKRIVI